MISPFRHGLVAALLTTAALADAPPPGFVRVEGGTFRHRQSNYYDRGVTVSTFDLGRYEVTQKEWVAVMGSNPSRFPGDDRPVEMVSWYDCIEYCNRRSLQEGLQPYYTIDRTARDPNNENPNDDLKWTVTRNPGANGYRLPTEAEWEYAASGGQHSRSFTYSGGNDAASVGWFWQNSGDEPLAGLWNWPMIERNNGRTHPVGQKAPNELGLHDMSGNVREWCWDWDGDFQGNVSDPTGPARGAFRVWKGGGWMGGDFCGEPAFRAHFDPHSRGYDHGFRVCRSP